MKDYKNFIKAYYEFRKSIDFNRKGVLPELNKLVWYILVGIPPVPADDYNIPDAQEIAVDQRIAILKALFVEINRDQPEEFIDLGLNLYDKAKNMAKGLLKEDMVKELEEFLDKNMEDPSVFEDYKGI